MNIALRTATLATLGGAIPLGLAVLSSALRLVPVPVLVLDRTASGNSARAGGSTFPPK